MDEVVPIEPVKGLAPAGKFAGFSAALAAGRQKEEIRQIVTKPECDLLLDTHLKRASIKPGDVRYLNLISKYGKYAP